MFSKRFDLIALKFFSLRSFIDSGLMSATKIFFLLINFNAVSARIPEPVPISSIFREDAFLVFGFWFLVKNFFRKFAKKYESSDGL